MIKLDEQKTLALAGIYDSAGLQVVYDVMEFIVTESENELLGTVPWSESVLGQQAIAHAQRIMLTEVARQIDYLVKEHRDPRKPLD